MSETPFPLPCQCPHLPLLPMNTLFRNWTSRVLGYAGSESVLESAGDILEVAHAASTDSLSALGLLAPVVLSGLSGGISAGRAGVLLDVKRTTSTSSAQSVRLVVTLSEAGSSLGHLDGETSM